MTRLKKAVLTKEQQKRYEELITEMNQEISMNFEKAFETNGEFGIHYEHILLDKRDPLFIKVFNKGVNAALRGKSVKHCPYGNDDWDYQEVWLDGFASIKNNKQKK